jgi:hypothetical protein
MITARMIAARIITGAARMITGAARMITPILRLSGDNLDIRT